MSTAGQRLYSVPREAARAEPPRPAAEPSMEEILASIRRIIADDQAHSGPLPGEGVSVEAGIGASAITFDDDALAAGEADAPPPEAPAPRRAEARTQEQPRQPAAAERTPAPAQQEAPARQETAARAEAPARREPAAGGGQAEGERAKRPESPEPLLSTAADASAASAFQTLSSVVLSRSPRTVDDLVQDMLRPLLKAWLDENLPPLVEKLVKAEIERIARGNG